MAAALHHDFDLEELRPAQGNSCRATRKRETQQLLERFQNCFHRCAWELPALERDFRRSDLEPSSVHKYASACLAEAHASVSYDRAIVQKVLRSFSTAIDSALTSVLL